MAEAGHSGSALTRIEKLVGLLVAALGAWSAYQASAVKAQVDRQSARIAELQAELARSAEVREERKLNHEITIRIFDEVKDIYAATLPPEQMLNRLTSVAALLEAIPDPAVRTQLAAAVKAAIDSLSSPARPATAYVKEQVAALKSQVDETVFRAEEKEAAPETARQRLAPAQSAAAERAATWSDYDVDLFWCEEAANPEAARREAETAARLRAQHPEGTGRWRVRKLPTSVNARAGYRIGGYVLHVTGDDEQRVAEQLQAALRRGGDGPAAPEFVIRRSAYPSPRYISAFFCPGARGS
jgi:hypothetical protein